MSEKSIKGTEIRVCSDRSLDVTKEALLPTGQIVRRKIATFKSVAPTVLGTDSPAYDCIFIVEANKDLKNTDSMKFNKLVPVFKAYRPQSHL